MVKILLQRILGECVDKHTRYTRSLNFWSSRVTIYTAFKPLTKEHIAEVLGISLRTIENWVADGTLPAPKKLGNRVYWHPNAFFAWLDHRLSTDCEADSVAGQTVAVPTTKAERTKPRASAKSSKTELDTLRSREQAKLDAMLS